MDDSVAPVVAGYRLGAVLGRGSSASVWSGRRVADGRPVAIKVVPLPAGGDEGPVRELGLLRGLGGDHVVTLLDAVPVSDPGDALALVMDRYDGGSLGRVVAARGRLTAGEIVTALSPVAAALGGLHRAGVVHGDLTPGNVLFDDSGRPAICDLGITRIIGERTDTVFGTRGFIAPEVTVGEPATPASDVYAVGALAWFCATGEATEPGWLRQALSAETLVDLPAALVDVIDACLAAEPAARPSAVELSLDLFESAPAEPLHLPGAADDVDSLTRRIRANALASAGSQSAEDLQPVATGPARWWRRRVRGAEKPPRSTPGAERVAEPETKHSARHASPPAAASQRRRVPVLSGAVVAVLAAVFVTVGGLVAVAAGWEPSGVLPQRVSGANAAAATPTASATTKVGTTVTAVGSSVVASPTTSAPPRPAPAQRGPVDLRSAGVVVATPLAAAQALADARAALWTSGDVAGLATVDAPGSAAWADDAQRIGEATAGGWRYRDVRFTIRSATVLTHTTTTASVRVLLDSAAYDVIGPQGPQHRAGSSGQQMVLDLVRIEAGWRVSRVDA